MNFISTALQWGSNNYYYIADSNIFLENTWTISTYLHILSYFIIFLISTIGNLLVIGTILYEKRRKQVINTFLLNLAVNDLLLVGFCMPFTLIGFLLQNFIFGEFLCKIIAFLQGVTVSVLAWTLVAIAVERYYAICYPLKSIVWQTKSHCFLIITIIWIGSFFIMSPIVINSKLIDTKIGNRKCREVWISQFGKQTFNILLYISLLIVPFILLVFFYSHVICTICKNMKHETNLKIAYSIRRARDLSFDYQVNLPGYISSQRIVNLRNKKRVIKMLCILVLEFFICWTPIFTINLIASFSTKYVYKNLGTTAISFFHLLSYSSSCFHPITYCFMNKAFRESFFSLFTLNYTPWSLRFTSEPTNPPIQNEMQAVEID